MQANFKALKLSIFGESHSEFIGMELWGIPAGLEISQDAVQAFLNRRKSANNAWSTPRREADIVEFESGIKNGKTDGGVIRAVIKNTAQKPADYADAALKPRPSHADYAAYLKGNWTSGGGRFSGRMTAPLCMAGAIAVEILKTKGVEVAAYISEIGGILSTSYKTDQITLESIRAAQQKPLAVLSNDQTAAAIEKKIAAARADGDSLGGAVECAAFGLPAGLGDAMFDGLEGRISYALFAIPAVKAVEFGAGFDLVKMRGSEANDQMYVEGGNIKTLTNNSGGICGGVSNGMPLTLRVGIKPTPSIARTQHTVDLATMQNTTLEVSGRHDVCIVPRAVPCVEAAVAVILLDTLLENLRSL
jgi:chorismate synthase